jgi:acyl-CoA thioesterase I
MVLALAAASPPALPVVVAFGDSITEGYGVARGDDYPAQLERALAQRGVKVRMVNAGVSGDTTNNALDRVASVIAAKPSLVLLEFGGNDGLRGFPPDLTRKNLNEAIERLQRAGARVALIGMTLPKNYGSVYLTRFEQVFKDLSAQHKLTLIPVAGYGRFVDFLLPFVTAELRAAKAAAKPRL